MQDYRGAAPGGRRIVTTQRNGPPSEVGPRPGYDPRTEGTDSEIKVTTTGNVDSFNVSSSAAVSRYTSSREIDFVAVAEFVANLDSAEDLELPGSLAWCAWSDSDPRKLAACLRVVPWWAFDIAERLEAEAEASKAVAASTDWSAVAREIFALNSFRANHPEAKRVVA